MKRVAFIFVLAALAYAVIGATVPPAAASVPEKKPAPCKVCGEAITGAYFETRGVRYHPECFVCGHCGSPIRGEYTTYSDHSFHTECFERHVAKRCALCDGVVQGEFLLDFWGNAYHFSHRDDTDECEYCGRFIAPHTTGGGVRYSDGRFVCGICRQSAVTRDGDALAILAEVARHLRRFGMDVQLGEIRLHLVGLPKMQQLSGKGSPRLTGFTDYEENRSLLGLNSVRRIEVYLLYGMPRIDVISTLSHELAHVWQFTAGRIDNDESFSEGSCNYASFLVLQNYPTRESEYVIANLLDDENRVYGEGFRRVRSYAEKEGIDAWLERLAKKDRLPRGY